MPQGVAGMPLPQGGPTPPQNSNHATSVTPTQQQVEGGRNALDERKATLQGQNNNMINDLNPPLDSPSLGGSPF